VTFQHLEYTWYDVPSLQSHDFFEIARDAAPVIVSGSQAHIPQGMTFVGSTFIHFGLGNLLFDQMSDVERTSFFDRHYFYDGRYLGNQLETIKLENYSQPRFLVPEERSDFLSMIFATCKWNEVFAEGK
jgi:poly-gamma-glutamate synthesis protein (capsule biosynthesis protein)